MKNHDFEVISSSYRPTIPPSRPSAAFLWDESFLWGVMAHKAFTDIGIPFELIRSDDIRGGRLKDFALLFVPGGWASNKLKALGDEGVEETRRFVHDGGAYVGFCGGAGLATRDGIGLLPVKRRPTRERVPSFSGRIGLNISSHPLWNGLADSELRTQNSALIFHAWWPSQFEIEDENAAVIAAYGEAMPDSFSSDVNVGDAESCNQWTELERIYRINLDPKRLIGEPAVIEGSFGKGKVVLSLVHFDTPGDRNGAAVLRNLWTYLGADIAMPEAGRAIPDKQKSASCSMQRGPASDIEGAVLEMDAVVSGLIDLGQRNFLWYWRNPMLLQWRRGVRGLEYCTLSVQVKEIVRALAGGPHGFPPFAKADLEPVKELLLPFVEKAKHLLLLERYAMQGGHITYELCDDPVIRAIREELFSQSKSYGGQFKKLIDALDGLLFRVLGNPENR